ncbi:MAG: hypothetical protein KC917_14810, partial [Candidatus Omnitrophica bacterium]|nr:hypothetical protein [Candidatus Omnitrophota bacterium]
GFLIDNCIFWNGGNEIVSDKATITHSIVKGGHPGEGNLDLDPLFLDPENGNFHLSPDSPAIDSATSTSLEFDLDGNRRPVDVIGVGNDGDSAFEIGCYEFQLMRSDLNSDGRVDEMDLMILQRDWMKVSGASGGG